MENIDRVIALLNNTDNNELLSFLTKDDIVLTQIALLNINSIKSIDEARLIVNTLINHPSEIREYSSFLINKLMKTECNKFFQSKEFIDTFEISIYDVNPKVCRNILDILPLWKYKQELFERVLNNCFELIDVLKEKNKEKNHRYTKNSFHLYWNLFSIGILLKSVNYNEFLEKIINLLELITNFSEYTIREKGAFINKELCKLINNEQIQILKNKYLSDENFYVRNVL